MPDHDKQRGEGQGLLREIPSGLTMDLEPRTFSAMIDDAASTASEFGRLFPAVYLRFHRRDDKRSELPNASRKKS